MNYLTTKQVSQRWGISTRRIVVLASQGRIEGAKQMDGRWFIPENAVKPLPPQPHAEKKQERYVFPFLLACVRSEEQISAFTQEEQALYDLCLTCEAGEFLRGRAQAEALLDSKNPYIRLSALYYLPITCLYLGDYPAADQYTVLFRAACHSCEGRRTETELLRMLFDSEMASLSHFVDEVEKIPPDAVPEELVPMVFAWMLAADVIKLGTGGTKPNIALHELLCRRLEQQGYFFEAMYMHLCLAAYYGLVKAPEKGRSHMKQAIDTGVSHGTLFTLASNLIPNLEMAAEVLRDYPPELGEKLTRLAAVCMQARNGYAEYQGKTATLSSLKEEDYKLISFCLKDFTIEEMAAKLSLSRSTVNNRLRSIYQKLGIRSKNELNRVYLARMMN